MRKPVITKLFLGGAVTFVAGMLLAVASMRVGVGGGALVIEGPDIVGLEINAAGYAMVALAVIGALALVGGLLAGVIAWAGALANTIQRPDKTWFVLLLVLGVLSFGQVAIIAYLLAGPDGTPTDMRPTPVGA